MNPGDYKTRVTVQRLKRSLSVNAAGHVDETTASNWETYCERWAKISYKASAEYLTGDQVIGKTTCVVSLISDEKTREIDLGMRVKFGSNILSVSGPPKDVDEMRREVVFPCIEAA